MNVRRTLVLLLLCFISVANIAYAASPNVVISQVSGGGGNSGAQYRNDFIELFNRGTAPVSLAGWSVQYASAAGTTWAVTPLSGTLAPGQYYLVQEAVGAGSQPLLPTPDASGTIAMSATAGKVALVASTAALTGTCPAGVVDFVGFGTTANCFEGAPTANLSNTTAARRAANGCTDTDQNNADFTIGAPTPRNTAVTIPSCGGGNNAPAITAPANPIATVTEGAAPFTVGLTGTDDGGIYNWSATAGTGVATVTVTGGQGTANVTYTVTLQGGFSGTASFVASLSDNVNPAVTSTVNVSVTPLVANDPPTINGFANPVATVAQDAAPFTVSFSGLDDNGIFNWSAVTGSGVSSVAVTGGQGTANVTYTVTLQPGFSGTASFTARLSDNVNPQVTAAVTITVTPAPPPPLDHVVISQVYGGGGNSGAAFKNDFVELYNASTVAFDLSGWTIQYGSATGTTWQVQPIGGTILPGEYYLVKLATNGAVGADVPAANVDGSLNLSGTNGKVALVSNGDALDGCVVVAPVVDLVGYGSTANCREGAGNAPTPSNALAVFRKNGGFTDTNVNSADFVTGTPNPRRTAPIVEIGPAVLNTDPRNNSTTAPRDASLTITFTEPVTVDAGWYTINCATTGAHNDATIAVGGPNAWIITPNVTFLAGELCTATIVKDFVHDVDLDDSGVNADSPGNNYTFSFSIATGAAPSYPADVHLTFGNPSGATADLFNPNNYLMEKPEFALSYNRDRGTPNWVSWHLADEWIGSLVRVDTFRPDPAIPADWYRVTHADYFGSGFDRGHMVPNADRDPETSMPINQATFLMTNMIPQAPDNNQGPWANMENYLRTLLPANEVYIIAGGSGTGGSGSSGFMSTFANGNVTVPAVTWKVALVIPKASGDDIARVTAGTRTISVIMPNTQGIRTVDWMTYLTTVDAVEALTGYDLYANISDAIENAVEAGVNGTNPPGVADQTVNADEDIAETFTLEAAAANSNSLTYTIVSSPSNGTLSGTGASQTYTPAPDFHGTDSFTFRVSDGSLQSNVATVTITVYEVNDAPTAADDSRNTDEDTALQFAASELTSNDSAGPADESSQTLTVSSVSGAVNGSVVLDAGTITFTPAPNFHGSASFTYEVCDSSLCATATVNVAVASVNDVPAAEVSAPSTGVEGSAVSASVSVTDLDAGDSYTATWSVTKNGAPYASSNSFTPDDNGEYVVSVTVTDDAGATATASATVTVANAAPAIGTVTGPTGQLAAGTPATVSVTYTDAGSADTHTATFTWSDGATSTVACAAGTCTSTRTFAAAGIYTATIVVSDDDGGTASATFSSAVVYDANAGFITGGGWFGNKANFNVNAKYHKGATTPTGSTKFELSGATLQSTSYDWLVVTGNTAQLRGTATVNGTGSYAFVVTVVDGNPDTFRIQVWDSSNAAIYDSATQAVTGGNITVHNK
ncbi:MAG TPA: DNA/RNA non-specific endonuclease [Thermoanaerobaculia bacterium]|nr:DNA/RNA non-specific endonuclease [Thermoanaerobaculia bacterium]